MSRAESTGDIPDPSSGPHPSAVEFLGLSEQVITATLIPEPSIQVYQQEPENGLFYRRSGRLLTSQKGGGFVDRARSGLNDGELFELQRAGSVTRQRPHIEIPGRVNPVHCLDPPQTLGYISINWIDESGMHNALPVDNKNLLAGVTVISWLEETVMGDGFAKDPFSTYDAKTRS